MKNNMLALAIALCLSSLGAKVVPFGLFPSEGPAIPLKGRGVAAEKRRAAKERRRKCGKSQNHGKK